MEIRELPDERKLINLAEEASELAQAALKLVRVLGGDTPVTEEAARCHLLEEIADVEVCTFAVLRDDEYRQVMYTAHKKAQRWKDRINNV